MAFHIPLPADPAPRKWTAIALTVVISGLLTLWGIYAMGQYGIALFIITPLFIGAAPALLYGNGINRTKAFGLGFLTLLIFTLALLVFAIEGIICIAMAAPVAALLTAVGCMLGYAIIKKKARNSVDALLILITAIPLTAFVEKNHAPELTPVVTSIDIDAPPSVVWNQVVSFPQLEEPTELLFKAGIAYPINASIEGRGVGAMRYCNFTTGSFVEPITVWNEPHLLRFGVLEQPAPMRELSFWNINAPHLHDYFVSKQGQFKLTELPGNRTRLEGTTWYYHNIKPAFYWRAWSTYIVHSIHNRVLRHIKKNSEKSA